MTAKHKTSNYRKLVENFLTSKDFTNDTFTNLIVKMIDYENFLMHKHTVLQDNCKKEQINLDSLTSKVNEMQSENEKLFLKYETLVKLTTELRRQESSLFDNAKSCRISDNNARTDIQKKYQENIKNIAARIDGISISSKTVTDEETKLKSELLSALKKYEKCEKKYENDVNSLRLKYGEDKLAGDSTNLSSNEDIHDHEMNRILDVAAMSYEDYSTHYILSKQNQAKLNGDIKDYSLKFGSLQEEITSSNELFKLKQGEIKELIKSCNEYETRNKAMDTIIAESIKDKNVASSKVEQIKMQIDSITKKRDVFLRLSVALQNNNPC